VDATTTATIHKPVNIFARPEIWIAIVALNLIVLTGPFDREKEYRVIMKKKTINRKGI
jgi:hypothetical protein